MDNNIDKIDINQTCFDYIEGFFESNGERIRRGVYSDVVKRNIQDGQVSEMSLGTLIEITESEKRTKPQIIVDIYDIHQDIATVKITSNFIDYVHLAKINDRWQVINVLWGF